MLSRSLFALATAALLAGACTVQPPVRDPERCVSTFRQYDREERFSSPTIFTDDESVTDDPDVARLGQRLLTRGCLTSSDDLTPLASLDARFSATRGVGAPIAPISVHLGVVGGITDEVRVRGAFSALGYRVRSVGSSALLGRRLYVGPFANAGDLRQALDAARAAGFIAPYPARF